MVDYVLLILNTFFFLKKSNMEKIYLQIYLI